jgi:hypothetical protein
MPIPTDIAVVAAVDHCINRLDQCKHPWVRPRTCIDCACHDVLWHAGLKPQNW